MADDSLSKRGVSGVVGRGRCARTFLEEESATHGDASDVPFARRGVIREGA